MHTNENNRKQYTTMSKKRIFKKDLAMKLIQKGCNLVDMERNKFNPNYQVFVFEQNENFNEMLTEMTQG